MKKHFFITFLGITLGLLISYFIVESAASIAAFTTLHVLGFSSIGIVVAYLTYFTTKKLDTLFPWQKQESFRLLFGLLLHFIVAFIIPFSFIKGFQLFQKDFQELTSEYIKLAIILFFVVLIYEVIYFALYSYYSYASFQIETVRQDRKQVELQLKALKSQLSPHFLFNSLNTISSLLYKDVTKAEMFIRRLATMYQYTLNSYHKKLITLEEELAFVRSYQYLLETRFKDKFSCDIAINEALITSKIPPLTLQMLVENAVKHNQLDEENPLHVSITADAKYITVHNNVTKKSQKVSSFHIGLKNINARYLLLHNKGIVVTNGSSFIVKIPIIA